MSFYLERTVREHRPSDKEGNWSAPTPLHTHASTHAWVLIADPGAGKTEAFKALAQAEGGTFIPARDFIELGPPQDYRGPLFIDGLDEYTATQGNTGHTAIGLIRSRLQQLGTPPFRIACREADWRGSTDSEALQRLVTHSQVTSTTFSELHLEPLTEAQTLEFIRHQKQWDDAQARSFIHSAQGHDLEGLLDNPQTLHMLLKSVTPDQPQFPTSKLETYQRACATLVLEHNEAHLAASGHVLRTDAQVLQAAGYLCAVMLLSGSASIAKQPRQQHPAGVLVLRTLLANQPNAPTLEACQEAVQTKLFAGTGSGSFVPRHRTVAEYLAANYVAQRLQEGLPLTRVLALMQGEDGGVVPALRGLHAWLAVAACAQVRENLIDRDPLGLVLHGDVHGFTVTEKMRLLQALKQEATRYTHFRSQNWASKPFGALATRDMQTHFQTMLRSPDRSPAHLATLDCVLEAMRHGHAMPELAPELEQVVRDKTHWDRMRRTALDTLCSYEPAASHVTTLRQLLEDIGTGKVEDQDMDLRGALLSHLYPKYMPAAELWQWYLPPKPQLLGTYWGFWHEITERHMPITDSPILLDALLTNNLSLQSPKEDRDLRDVIGKLLCHAIDNFGCEIQTERMHAWLGLGLRNYSRNGLSIDHQKTIASWLSAHPEHYKALMKHGITHLENSQKPVHLWLYELQNRLCHAQPPDDADHWLLSLAEHRTDDFRLELIAESFRLTTQRQGFDAALEAMMIWAKAHPQDRNLIERSLLSCPYPPSTATQEHITWEIEHKAKERQEKEAELQFLREKLPGLTGPEPHLGLLVHVGENYLNIYSATEGDTSQTRLLKALNDDPHWVEMALSGLRQCLERTDLPSANSVIDLHLKGSSYRLAIPCLAAIELRYVEQPAAAFDGLLTAQLETLVAFRLTNDYGNQPAWFRHLVLWQPALVGQVMQQLMARQMAAKREHIANTYALSTNDLYATIAQHIAPALIQALPAKASKNQLAKVRDFIACLLNRLPHPTQLELIEEKLALPKMDVAQRTYWLTAGLLVCQETYVEPLKAFLGSNQTRASHAFDLLHTLGLGVATIDRLTPEVRTLFIELLGVRFAPFTCSNTEVTHWVTPAIEAAEFVQRLITSLAADPTDAATQALSSLEQNPALKTWHEHIRRAVYEQHIARRKALFQPASVDAVCKTLANRQPANAADLWALTVNHLTMLADSIRNGSTNDYRQYWDKDRQTPKIENDCRDALLSDLKERLQTTGVNAESEGSYADNKRSDIKVVFGNWHIPVEIKRDTHPDVWIAIRDQLIAKYSREAASDGYGIYIVFWFQGNLAGTPVDGGRKPTSPQELQQRLAATVPPELQSRIAVLVIDCSMPTTTTRTQPI